ncbi:MAG: hypothetical protein RI924_483 [Bacteroidota bacterium]
MTDKQKRIFLAICITVPFILYCVYYYGIMIKNAPYKFSEMESITLKYGLGDSLVNQYDSKTGVYQYVNEQDSLVQSNVKLTKDDLLYLHRKAVDMGFWNFPADMTAKERKYPNAPRYYLEFNYERKSKAVYFDLDYQGNEKLQEAAKILIETVSKTINDAEDRQNK